MQQVKAGLDPSICPAGRWQGTPTSRRDVPDQSLYPADSVPAVVRRINNTLRRADEIHHAEGDDSIDWLKPIVADAEAGFGGVLNAFELMKQMIDAALPGFTSRISCRRPRNAVTWWQGSGAHQERSTSSSRRAWRRTCAMCRRC